jgi:hypothetical protein
MTENQNCRVKTNWKEAGPLSGQRQFLLPIEEYKTFE